MYKIFLFSFVFIISGLYVKSQNDEQSKSFINDFHIYTGFSASGNQKGSINDFLDLAPNSKLLAEELINDSSFYSTSNFITNPVFELSLGVNLAKKNKKLTPKLRFGIQYSNGSMISGGAHHSTLTPYDTIISTKIGETYYLDSINTRYYNTDYKTEQIKLLASLIYQTNEELRWTLYSGIGMLFGVSFNSNTNISYTEFHNFNIRNFEDQSYQSLQSSYNFNIRNETHTNKPVTSFAAYVPLGIDFKIGKTNPFWKNIHLQLEFRPGIQSNIIPELETITSTFIQYNFGIRYSL